MSRKLVLLAAALLLLTSCATSYSQAGGCLRGGWHATAHPIPTIADAGAALAGAAATLALRANGVNVGVVIVHRINPLELCRTTGIARGVDPVCRHEPLAKP